MSTSTMVTVPDWAQSAVQQYASTAYTLMNEVLGLPSIIIANGIGAQFNVIMGSTSGAIQSIMMIAQGSGYTTTTTASIVGGTGSGCTLSVTVVDGAVTKIDILNGGHGYTLTNPPVVVIHDPGSFDGNSWYGGSGASAFVSSAGTGTIASIQVLAGGTGYVNPVQMTITGAGGSGAQAWGIANSAGLIVAVQLSDGGHGYTAVPSVRAESAGGGATAIPFINSGVITSIMMLSGGSGYTITPSVYIVGGAGSGATATANVSGGVVTSVTMVSGGSGYTTNAHAISAYSGDITASQNAHELLGITNLATRGASGNATISAGKAYSQNIINGGTLTVPAALLSTISAATLASFTTIRSLIGKKAMYVGDPDSTTIAQTLTETTYDTYTARLVAKLNADNYIRERASQDFNIGYATEFAKEEVADAETLRKSGLYIRQYLQSTYEPLNRLFIEAEEANVVRVEIFGNALRALTGSQQTQTSTDSNASPLMQAVGVVSTGLGLYNAMSTALGTTSTALGTTSTGAGAGVAEAAYEASVVSYSSAATAGSFLEAAGGAIAVLAIE